jgi:hypothetical protein
MALRRIFRIPPSTVGTGENAAAGTLLPSENSYQGHQLAVSIVVPPTPARLRATKRRCANDFAGGAPAIAG